MEYLDRKINEMTKDFKCCVSCEMFGGYVDDKGNIINPECLDCGYGEDYCTKCTISRQQAKVLILSGYKK